MLLIVALVSTYAGLIGGFPQIVLSFLVLLLVQTKSFFSLHSHTGRPVGGHRKKFAMALTVRPAGCTTLSSETRENREPTKINGHPED